MKGLREKLRNHEGFTLVEMLIVVAIIAILIAVSIPLVGSALEKARDATDAANERAAKAEAAIKYLGVEDGSFKETIGTFYYNAVDGKLEPNVDEAKKITAYGKCTGCGDTAYPNSDKDHTSAIIKVEIKTGGDIAISWVAACSLGEFT